MSKRYQFNYGKMSLSFTVYHFGFKTFFPHRAHLEFISVGTIL